MPVVGRAEATARSISIFTVEIALNPKALIPLLLLKADLHPAVIIEVELEFKGRKQNVHLRVIPAAADTAPPHGDREPG
ncbi:hypothetical protein [Synechococcus sp. 1G10]|uniref:hypothetical protein n=1 Tax=Synechococcus sp. 1G10 TaxID=2025605 RepID=UPI0011811D30|nr:hypothetical protein [Synechococcus sp. 1G10]